MKMKSDTQWGWVMVNKMSEPTDSPPDSSIRGLSVIRGEDYCFDFEVVAADGAPVTLRVNR